MPHSAFDRITIIFNPNSTGDSPRLARELYDQIGERLPGTPRELTPTERAGHAEELARAAAGQTKRPLIISVSGDGGYHEVINGLMQAANPDATAAVLGAGNANDHRSATRRRPLIEAITAGRPVKFDLLKVDIAGRPSRYAHSYAGLGISPVVAMELNRHSLNPVKEMQLVLTTFRAFEPFRIQTKRRRIRTYDSLVCANIPRMAKFLKLSSDSSLTDGRFELVRTPHRGKIRLIFTALRYVTLGAPRPPQVKSFTFTTLDPMPMQLDGELQKLPAGTRVTVSAAKRIFNTLI